MELRVFARLPPSLRCCLGTLMLVLSLCSPQYFGVSASAEFACQPKFLLVRWKGFASILTTPHLLTGPALHPTGPLHLVPRFPAVPWPCRYTAVSTPRISPTHSYLPLNPYPWL